MAQITFNIPADKTARVLEAFAVEYGYQDTIDGGANPETKAAFTKRMIIEYVKNITKSYEAGAAAKTARESSIDGFDIVIA